jgi:hypothetical protein
VIGAVFAGMRFPRSMLANPASERLLESLGVEIVSDRDCELEDYARAWLAQMDATNEPVRERGGNPPGRIATEAVRRALERRAA